MTDINVYSKIISGQELLELLNNSRNHLNKLVIDAYAIKEAVAEAEDYIERLLYEVETGDDN